MQKRSLEPGLLTVFRLFTGLRLAGAVVFMLARFAAPDQNLHLAELIEPAVLLALLSVPVRHPRQEPIVLPVALVVAGVGPLLSQAELLSTDLERRLSLQSILTLQVWASMIVLLLPVVIIAWQYRLQHAVLFSISITLLNVVLVSMTAGMDALESPLVASSIVFRLITFIVVGWLVVRLMQGQREQRHALREANTKLMHHTATLEQLAITRERNRLARELHDTLAHTLSAVAIQLEAVDALWAARPDDAHQRLQKTIEATRSGLTETRRALQDLRASPLEDLGLALALRNLATSTAARGGLKLDLHIAEDLGTLSPDVGQAVYRIAQESLANVANHANARHLTVQLKRIDGLLTLTVSDDGAGFDLTEQDSAKRFGLQGMRERAETVGGTLTVESQPGQGTIVMLFVEVSL